MWTRGITVALLAVGLASAQTTKPPAKSPAKAAAKLPTKAPAKSASKSAAAKPAVAKAKTATASAPAEQAPAIVVPTRTLLPPKDDTARDRALGPFLAKLKEILKRKDRDGLLALLAEDIDLGIRDMRGKGAFFTAWGLGDRDASVYGVLAQILSLNGAWVEQQYCGPYVSVLFPKELDRSKHQVVLNPDVKLRATAAQTGAVVTTLAYEVVDVVERGPEWTKVRTIAAQEGYVQTAYLYSPAGYRACFAKNAEGAWQIQSLALPR